MGALKGTDVSRRDICLRIWENKTSKHNHFFLYNFNTLATKAHLQTLKDLMGADWINLYSETWCWIDQYSQWLRCLVFKSTKEDKNRETAAKLQKKCNLNKVKRTWKKNMLDDQREICAAQPTGKTPVPLSLSNRIISSTWIYGLGLSKGLSRLSRGREWWAKMCDLCDSKCVCFVQVSWLRIYSPPELSLTSDPDSKDQWPLS